MGSLGSIQRFEATVLFIGDLFVFYVSLWLTLSFRYFALPDQSLWSRHAAPFTILFVVWVLVFFIAGLYEKHTSLLKSRLPSVVLNAQIVNGFLAVLFFFLIPYFGITPKTTLFIYLIISFVLILVWRQWLFLFFGKGKQQPAVLVGSGAEMQELYGEVNSNARYGIHFVLTIDLDEVNAIDFEGEVIRQVYAQDIATVVIDTKDEKVVPILPRLYNMIFSGVRFIDMHKVYEDIFDRVPLSLVRYSWFLENISVTRKFSYEFMKRVMDIIISLPLFILSLLFYPFVFIATKISDGGPLFYTENRVGKNNKFVGMSKFRSMTGTDSGEEVLNSKHTVTGVGELLRKTRVDELPQLWSVLKGDFSLIGPRPELPALVEKYSQHIPYYNVRHLVKPGLSGWAQVYHDNHPHHGTDVDATKEKLSYDLYYIKNRSFLLDLKIALKTIKKLASRAGV